MVASALALVTALDLVFAATNGGELVRAMVTTEKGLSVMALAVFVIIITYSRHLGIYGQPRTQKIMYGFVLYLSVNVLAVFVRGSARSNLAVIAIVTGMGAYCASLIYWTIMLGQKETAPGRMSPQQTRDLTTVLGQLQERAADMGVTVVSR